MKNNSNDRGNHNVGTSNDRKHKTKNNIDSKSKNEMVQNINTTVNVESISYEIPASSNQALSEEEILNGYRNGTIIPENNGKYWTDEDRNKLASMFNSEVGITRIALDFKRKELAVMQQLVVMGLLNTPAYHRGQKEKDCGCLCSKCLNFECENNPNRPNR